MDASPNRTYRIGWLRIAAIWSVIAIFDATRTVVSMRAEGMHHAWTKLFFGLILSWVPWAFATPLIALLGRRYPQTRLKPSWGSLIHLAACLLIGLVASLSTVAFDLFFNPFAESGPLPAFLPLVVRYFDSALLLFLLLYAAILACTQMLDSSRHLARQQIETAQLNEQLSKAQLNALQRQIEPHFLFNTLNSIAGLVRQNRNDDAVNMLAGLSEFLREALRDSGKQRVSLASEMAFVQKYLDIQKVRFADRLQLSVLVPDDLLEAQVPRFTLQPVVENAFKHGISQRALGGAIRIAASRSRNTLMLSVYNDGPRLRTAVEAAASSDDAGTGIANLRTRLQALYGDTFRLDIHDDMHDGEPGGVEVSISLPFQLA